jgi:hypothetical protein
MAIKRIARVVSGFVLLVAGVLMLVLPGPGIAAIAAGLALLAQDFPWAHRWLERGKKVLRAGWERAKAFQARRRST